MHLAIIPLVTGCGSVLVIGAVAGAMGVKAGIETIKAVKQGSSNEGKKETT